MKSIKIDTEQRIKKFFLFERLVSFTILLLLIIAFFGLVLTTIFYQNYSNNEYYIFLRQVSIVSCFISVILIIINVYRPRQCPKCGEEMIKYATDGTSIKFKCNKCNIEVDTHISYGMNS